MTWENNEEAALERLQPLVSAFDHAGAAAWCDELVDRIQTTEASYPKKAAQRVLRLLRQNRWFDLMAEVAEALITADVDEPSISRQYAQALIDSGRVVGALAVVDQILARQADTDPEYIEALGLRGRCFKQMYVTAGSAGFERNHVLLRRAIESYETARRTGPGPNHWQAVNLVALILRAERDGVALDGVPDARGLAGEIVKQIEAAREAGSAASWDLATAGEASLALGDLEGAHRWMSDYVESDVGSFQLAGTLRQLEEVWEIGSSPAEQHLLDLLRGAVLARQDGGAVVTDLQRAAPDESLERVLGTTGVKSLAWYRSGLSCAESVARVCDPSGSPVGTAFVLDGGALSERLPAGELFAVTNAHVVSETVAGALYPGEAYLGFEASGVGGEFGVAEILFESPPTELDVAVLRLDRVPEGITSLQAAARALDPVRDQRVYVIGHPRGGGLSYSLQDNLLLDVEQPRLHYRAPTEKGSSGSPVFDEHWRLVGIHHAGGPAMHRLNGVEGTYAANEGISIGSITAALDAALAAR